MGLPFSITESVTLIVDENGNIVGVTNTKDLKTADICNTSGVYKELIVGLTPVELKVGPAPLANRKYITMQPKDKKIYWGYDNTVTATSGTQVFKNQLIMLPIGGNVSVWLIADGPDKKVSIGELS